MFGIHGWLHLMTTAALAMVLKEYLNLRSIVHIEHQVKLWHSGPLPEPPTSRPVEDELPPPEFITDNIIDGRTVEDKPDLVVSRIESEGTSVWCHGNQHTNRVCRFRNICYLPDYDDFVFFHHNKSLLHGLPKNRFDPSLLDWSSVYDHNSFYFNYMDVPVEKAHILLAGAKFVKDVTLVYKRFLPDNVMHVFHDDLLPMFYTLQLITGQNVPLGGTTAAFDVQVFMMDQYSLTQYAELYNLFTYNKPVYKNELLSTNKPVCFKDAYLGISKQTTWYNYGFNEPQHPIPDLNITGTYIRQFTTFMKNKLGISNLERDSSKQPHIVLFSRKYSRIILNENELITEMIQKLNAKVVTVGVEDMTVKEIIGLVSQASVAVGMHGALMTFVMFLPPGAMVIELFPFAINPENYTPYKTLCELQGMGLSYKSWRNFDSKKTVTHPDRSKTEGGINHLSQVMQEKIKSSTEVQKHMCCSDPEFLFRIYQDTEVDVYNIINIAQGHLQKTLINEQMSVQNLGKPLLYPGEIQDASCKKNHEDGHSLAVSWLPPWNIPYLQYQNLRYEVLLQEHQSKVQQTVSVKTTTFVFKSVDISKSFVIWIRCIADTAIGPLNTGEIKCL